MLKNPVYIIAVSGGVDSVVLLHKITSRNNKKADYVVAHFDHGIRGDSNEDADFVDGLAAEAGIEFELGHGNLGKDASEDEARNARYAFLRKVAVKHDADRIITGHHQDDVLETMIINIIRGTGPRGLMPMTDDGDILRPLLNSTKSQLIEYAEENDLKWREDITNQDEKYLRNYVRKNIIPEIELSKKEFLRIRSRINELYDDIDMRINSLLPAKNILNRTKFVTNPYSVQKEIIRAWLIKNGMNDIDSKLVERIVMAAKTMPAGKQVDVRAGLVMKSEKQNVLLASAKV